MDKGVGALEIREVMEGCRDGVETGLVPRLGFFKDRNGIWPYGDGVGVVLGTVMGSFIPTKSLREIS